VILVGDTRKVLKTLPVESVQCCVTSPPYFGLRDYGVDGQIGLEPSPDEYVAELVAVFREVRRVLRADGTLWLNLGDSYARQGGEGGHGPNAQVGNTKSLEQRRMLVPPSGTKPKDLLMIPARVALALQADGWWLRSDIIWHKPNPMPESVTDRPTSAHEHVFLLTKSARYFYDAEAVKEEACYPVGSREDVPRGGFQGKGSDPRGQEAFRAIRDTRNLRNVWTIATQPFSGAHFATMPPDLVERCIKAGSRPGDMILDPFGGAGTTGLVAQRLGRDYTLIELNPTYADMARDRINAETSGVEGALARLGKEVEKNARIRHRA